MKVRITLDIDDSSAYANRDSFPSAMEHIGKAASNIVNGLKQHFELDAHLVEVEEIYGRSYGDQKPDQIS